MKTNNPHRYRVSSRMPLLKIGCILFIVILLFNLVKAIENNSAGLNILPYVLGAIILAGLFYFLHNLKRIDYDDIKQILYIVDTKNLMEIEVPVERIEKIYLSSIGFRGNGSYVIVYKDSQGQQQKVRLFPILFDDSIKTIRADAKYKNPNVIIRNWTFGWNELFD